MALLPVDPYRAFTSGQYNDVPLITGSTANEIGPFFAETEKYLEVSRTLIGDSFDRFIALFPAGPDGRTMISSTAGNGDRLFTWQNWTWADCKLATAEIPCITIISRIHRRFPTIVISSSRCSQSRRRAYQRGALCISQPGGTQLALVAHRPSALGHDVGLLDRVCAQRQPETETIAPGGQDLSSATGR